jgi:hypothetical protein
MTLGPKSMDGNLPETRVLRLQIRSIELNKSLERRILNIWLADHFVLDCLLLRQYVLWHLLESKSSRYNINAPLFWLSVLMARNLVQNRHRLSIILNKSNSCCRTSKVERPTRNIPSHVNSKNMCRAYSKIKRVLSRISSLKFSLLD